MKIYIINEKDSLDINRQLHAGGMCFKLPILSWTTAGGLSRIDLALKEDNDFDEEDCNRRDERGDWDQELKQRTVI